MVSGLPLRKLLIVLLTVALFGAACSDPELQVTDPIEGPDNPSPTEGVETTNTDGSSNVIRFLSGLTQFDDCDGALDHLREEAAKHVGPWGFEGGGFGGGPIPLGVEFEGDMVMEEAAGGDGMNEDGAMPEPEPAAESSDVSAPALPQTGGELALSDSADDTVSSSGSTVDFTGTNVQELGVDEPDIIKTDGTRILAVANNRLYYIDVSGSEATLLGSVQLTEGWAHEMFIDGDRAYVFATSDYWASPAISNFASPAAALEVEPVPEEEPLPEGAPPERAPATEPAPEPVPAPDEDFDAEWPEDEWVEEEWIDQGEWLGPAAIVSEIDISDPANMNVLAELSVEGQYLSARAVGSTGRLVLTSQPNNLQFVYPASSDGEERAAELNRQAVLESTLEDWVPTYTLKANGGTTTGLLLSCDRLHFPAEFAGFNIMSVLTIDLAGSLTPGDAVGIVANGETVYASTENLYVGTTVWTGNQVDGQFGPEWEENYSTAIHKFSINAGDPASYIASGSVPGHMLNQFAMNEHNGDLQVVTTDGAPWSETTESFLTVLRPDGDRLNQIGQVGDLGKGERVFSARLMGDVGYVVTFRQVDPFYVIDTSDPTNPFTAGELKIPGFSSYLHKVDENHVLGLGQDATDEGFTTGFKAELFDVSDPSNPLSVATWVAENAWSSAEANHRAFQILPDRNLAVIPINDWNSGFFGAVLLNLDDLTEYGRISQDVERGENAPNGCRQITTEMVPENSDSFWILQEGTTIQLCNEEDAGGSNGSNSCEIWPAEELQWMFQDWESNPDAGPQQQSDLPEAVEALGSFDRVEVCWPDYYGNQFQIERTLSIGDTLWSMSWQALQGNDLDSLDATARIELTN